MATTMMRDREGNEVRDGDLVRLSNRPDSRTYKATVRHSPNRGEDVLDIPDCEITDMTYEQFRSSMWVFADRPQR